MNPQDSNESSITNPVPDMAPDPLMATPEVVVAPPVTSPVVQKKSHKTLIIILAIVIAAVIGASVGYYLYAMKQATVPPAATTQAAIPTDPSLEALTTSLTDSSLSEITLTNTDDSSQATDATTSASMIGDSVDENNF